MRTYFWVDFLKKLDVKRIEVDAFGTMAGAFKAQRFFGKVDNGINHVLEFDAQRDARISLPPVHKWTQHLANINLLNSSRKESRPVKQIASMPKERVGLLRVLKKQRTAGKHFCNCKTSEGLFLTANRGASLELSNSKNSSTKVPTMASSESRQRIQIPMRQQKQ